MKKIILYMLMLLAVASCREKAEYDQTLGLMSEYNSLSEEGGSTQVAVFSNTSWTVEMDRQVSWASIDRLGGNRSGYIVFDFEANYGRSRRVSLVFNAGGQTRTLSMYQKARYADADCRMELGSSSIDATSVGAVENIQLTTNLVYSLDEMFLTVTYPEGQEPEQHWVTLESIDKDNVSVRIAPNTSGVARIAKVRLSHTDVGGVTSAEGNTIYSNTITVNQAQ